MSINFRDERVKAALLVTVISLASIVIILKFTNANISWQTISLVDARFLILALVLHVSSWIFYSIRLRLLTSMAGHDISFRLSLKTTLASNFVASITPSSAGGEPVRIKMLADDGMSYGSATAVAVGERLLDSVFLIAALALFLIASGFFTGFGLEIGTIFLVLLVLFLTFLWQLVVQPQRIARLLEWIKKKTGNRPIVLSIEREVWLFREAGIQLSREILHRTPVMAAVTTLIWMCDFLVPSVLLIGMGTKPIFLLSVTAQIILAIIGLLPLTPGGSGVAELSMGYLYSMFVAPALLVPLVVLWRLITYFFNIMVGAILTGASIIRWRK